MPRFALVLALLLLPSCGPQKRNPDVSPFPKPESVEEYNRRKRWRLPPVGLNQTRCFGGGIGGCSYGGKAIGGPVNE